MAVKKVGTLIREARTAKKLSQEQLANGIDGLSGSDIGKAERGEKDLSQAQLRQLRKHSASHRSLFWKRRRAAVRPPRLPRQLRLRRQRQLRKQPMLPKRRQPGKRRQQPRPQPLRKLLRPRQRKQAELRQRRLRQVRRTNPQAHLPSLPQSRN